MMSDAKQDKQGDDEKMPNPFDPDSLRLNQDFGVEGGVKRVLLKVPVRKPSRQEFIRVHPDATYSVETTLVDLKEDRDFYLVPPEFRAELFDEIVAVRLYTTISRQGVISLWPCRLPGPDGRTNAWHDTAIQAAEMAKSKWVRVQSDMNLGAYQPYVAVGELPEPKWPEENLEELLKMAFSNLVIDRPDHPVIQRLRGQI
jgi:hypothetical protein